MKISNFISISAVLSMMIINCTPKELTNTVAVANGTRIVHNISPAWGDEQRITLNLVRTLGDVDVEDDENYLFSGPRAVQIDRDDNIYVLESEGHSIKKYDKNYKYITTIGYEGSGPGEFKNPVHIEIGSDNRMYVNNYRNSRIEVMTLEGDYIESIRLLRRNWSVLRFDSGDYAQVIGQRPFIPIRDDELNTLVHIYDRAGHETNVFGKMREYEDINMAAHGNRAQLAHDYDNIFISMQYQNRIEKYTSSGDLLLKISRQLPYEEGIVLHSRKDNLRAPNFSRSISLDEKGRIWVQTYVKQLTPEEWEKENFRQLVQTMLEIYDETGILLTRIKTGPTGDYVMSLIKDNLIYFISAPTNMDVKIYEIVER